MKYPFAAFTIAMFVVAMLFFLTGCGSSSTPSTSDQFRMKMNAMTGNGWSASRMDEVEKNINATCLQTKDEIAVSLLKSSVDISIKTVSEDPSIQRSVKNFLFKIYHEGMTIVCPERVPDLNAAWTSIQQ